MRNLFLGLLTASAMLSAAAHAQPVAVVQPVAIVAGENFYGDIATQIGGADVAVRSILTNPDQDPHEFEASPATARQLADARLVIYNGADYDPWMVKLLSASTTAGRATIEVAQLVHKNPGDNPHLWYEPGTAPALAKALAAALAKLDPSHAKGYADRLTAFEGSLAPLTAKIAELKRRYAGMPVTATEPVFGYMAEALGLKMRNAKFQLAVMNDTEPGAKEIAAFEKDLRTKAVKVLLYNNQTEEALTKRMRGLAQDSGVPVVGVSETEPPGKTFQEWMLSQLDALDQALTGR
jgi:zinc/manganese transport system substrate-binding protein